MVKTYLVSKGVVTFLLNKILILKVLILLHKKENEYNHLQVAVLQFYVSIKNNGVQIANFRMD